MNQTIAVVTSCSLEGWNKYGKKAVETLIRYWPSNVVINLVSEDTLPTEELVLPEDKEYNLTLWPMLVSTQVVDFYKRHEANNRAKGILKKGQYSFRHDAYRFSKKVFAIEMVATAYPTGRLFWLDADTVTHKEVPEVLLKSLLPDETMLSFLDRPHYHSETSFIGFNLNHHETFAFIHRFAQLYATDEVFSLKEWHDAWVFDWLRKQVGLQDRVQFKIPHNSSSHPFVHSVLGDYMDHLKGRRKDAGKSAEHPMYRGKKRNA